MAKKYLSRRKFVRGAAAVSITGVAGCIGGGGNNNDNSTGNGGGDTTNIRMGASTEGSTTYQTSQAIQRVIRQQADSVRWDTQTTGGDPPGIRVYSQDGVDAYGVSNFTVRKAIAGEDPFTEQYDVAHQGFNYFTRDDFFLAVDGSGIETTDDLLGRNVWLLQPGWGTRQLFMEIMSQDPELHEQLTQNVVDIDAADVAGAVDEGRIEALLGYGANEINVPSWLAETATRTSLHTVEVSDQFRQLIEQSELAPYYEKEAYGFDQDVGDTFQGHQILFQFHFSPDVPAEAVYESLQVCHDHVESIREGQPALLPYGENPEHFTSAIDPSLGPVHAGAADFYEENDLWDDSWERGN